MALALARGDLEDTQALHAEAQIEKCAHCKAWWHGSFDSEASRKVEKAVSQTFAEIRLPARRRHVTWAAAACVVLMLIGISSLQMTRPNQEATSPVEASISTFDFESSSPAGQIQSLSFEDQDLGSDNAAAVVDNGKSDSEENLLFNGDNEDGSFAAWSLHT